MIAIHAQTERKRLDRSVRCAEKRRPWARKQRLRGLIRPDPAVCATAGAACGRKSLSSARIQAIFTSNDTPLGECRLGSFSRQSVELERNRPKLRLIDGEQFVELVLENYSRLSPRYRTLLPLKQIYVPDLQG
ncbi:hypothetical protein [Paracoccus sp. TOH]|uniref:hypothetical protein n=1 Tax=Paracoccus sp. TOH TaxID=1263728 RepID=UPI0025B05A09|nr:hypothetical protein [Paracoccus sp. TOH]WJS87041.1 hypothetical protein NBE95_18490 [Paracoccus sp. TOH]